MIQSQCTLHRIVSRLCMHILNALILYANWSAQCDGSFFCLCFDLIQCIRSVGVNAHNSKRPTLFLFSCYWPIMGGTWCIASFVHRHALFALIWTLSDHLLWPSHQIKVQFSFIGSLNSRFNACFWSSFISFTIFLFITLRVTLFESRFCLIWFYLVFYVDFTKTDCFYINIHQI